MVVSVDARDGVVNVTVVDGTGVPVRDVPVKGIAVLVVVLVLEVLLETGRLGKTMDEREKGCLRDDEQKDIKDQVGYLVES